MKHHSILSVFLKVVSLMLLAVLLVSCSGGSNPDVPAPESSSEAVTTEPPFDASVYTYTPSLKDESEMKFCVVFSGGVIVELPQYINGAPRFTEDGAEKFLGDKKYAAAAIDGYYFEQIIYYYGDKLPVIKYAEDFNFKLTNDLKISEKFFFKQTGSSGVDAVGEKYSEIPDEKGEYFLVIGATHNGEYGKFKMYYVAKIINA